MSDKKRSAVVTSVKKCLQGIFFLYKKGRAFWGWYNHLEFLVPNCAMNLQYQVSWSYQPTRRDHMTKLYLNAPQYGGNQRNFGAKFACNLPVVPTQSQSAPCKASQRASGLHATQARSSTRRHVVRLLRNKSIYECNLYSHKHKSRRFVFIYEWHTLYPWFLKLFVLLTLMLRRYKRTLLDVVKYRLDIFSMCDICDFVVSR